VHFAHAATYLLRALDVPARVAGGYAVPEEDRGSGSAIMIRGLNGHAWPEVYLQDVGWVVVDPAPEQVLDHMASQPDSTLQRMLGEMLRGERGEETLADVLHADAFALADLARALAWLTVLLVVAGFAVKLHRALLPRYAAEGDLERVGYRAVLDRLAEVGVARHRGESRERFALRAAGLTPSFADLTARHLRRALGRGPAAGRKAVRRLSHAVSSELHRGVSPWRRLLGATNPFSWLRAR